MTVEHIENTGIDIFHFEPGERAMVKRGAVPSIVQDSAMDAWI